MAVLSPTETREYNSTKTSYKSKYYDPEKAHEYYLKNRQLKGGYSTKGLSDETVSGWSYAKENVTNEKKQKLQAINAQYQAKIAEYREIAAQRRKELSNQISEALAGIKDEADRKKEAERLKKQLEMAKINKSAEEIKKKVRNAMSESIEEETERSVSERERASKDHSRRLKSLQSRLKNTNSESARQQILGQIESEQESRSKDLKTISIKSNKEKARIREAGANIMEAIRDQVSNEKMGVCEQSKFVMDTISSESNKAKQDVRDEGVTVRESISDQLSASIANARADRDKSKEALEREYKTIMDTEYTGVTGRSPGSNSGGKTDYDAIVKAYKEKHKKAVKK